MYLIDIDKHPEAIAALWPGQIVLILGEPFVFTHMTSDIFSFFKVGARHGDFRRAVSAYFAGMPGAGLPIRSDYMTTVVSETDTLGIGAYLFTRDNLEALFRSQQYRLF